jgi:adenosine deaminase
MDIGDSDWCVVLPSVFGQRVPVVSKSTPSAEMRAERALQDARKQGPLAVHAFFAAMPKGSDLHVHLSGAVYAESWIRAAGEDGLCVDPQSLSFTKPAQGECGNGRVSAKSVPDDQHLYDELIDAFSMRTFVPTTGTSGHDHFFDTFDKFSGTSKSHTGEWLDEVATRAAAQNEQYNEQYMELMITPNFTHTATLAKQIGYSPDLPQLRKTLLDAGLKEDIAVASPEIKEAQEVRCKLERCDTQRALQEQRWSFDLFTRCYVRFRKLRFLRRPCWVLR